MAELLADLVAALNGLTQGAGAGIAKMRLKHRETLLVEASDGGGVVVGKIDHRGLGHAGRRADAFERDQELVQQDAGDRSAGNDHDVQAGIGSVDQPVDQATQQGMAAAFAIAVSGRRGSSERRGQPNRMQARGVEDFQGGVQPDPSDRAPRAGLTEGIGDGLEEGVQNGHF